MKKSILLDRRSRLRVLLLTIALAPMPVLAGLATIDVAGGSRSITATMGALELVDQAAALPEVPQGVFLTMQRIVL